MRNSIAERLLIGNSTVLAIAMAAVPATALGSLLLLGTMHVYSAQMTWDLLFNLDGAWRLYNGQLPHVDFHTELGPVPFALTAFGFLLTGPSVMAVPIGECLLSALILTLAIPTAAARLPLFPGAIFATLCSLMILMPLTYGDGFGAYSFAMAYNRFGWSISTVIFMLLFVEPLADRKHAWKDCLIGLMTLLLLYYVKITYFAVGMTGLALAILLPGHIRANRKGWIAVFIAAAFTAVAPFNFAYLRDIANAALAGGGRTNLAGYFARFVGDPAEYAVAVTGCLLVTAIPQREQYLNHRFARTIGALFLVAAGALLISQNSQADGIPVYIVISLLVYRLTWDLFAMEGWRFTRRTCCFLLASMVFPALVLASIWINLFHYWYAQRERPEKLFAITDTNLRGLTVPLEDILPFKQAVAQEWTPSHFNDIRRLRPRYELTQIEYVLTLTDLASLFPQHVRQADPPPRILILDRVNALPFILGLPAPRGVDIWWGERWGQGLIRRSGDEVFADVTFVAIPRYSTEQRTTEDIVNQYGSYLGEHFGRWRETAEWLVLKRDPVASPPRTVGSAFSNTAWLGINARQQAVSSSWEQSPEPRSTGQ